LIGKDPYNKKNVQDSLDAAAKNATVLEEHLWINTYLVGERITLADIFTAAIISRGFEYFYDAEWRKAHPSVTRWFETIRNQSLYSDVVEKKDFIEKAIANVAPKKEKEDKPKAAPAEQPKKQEKKKKEDDEEEEDKPEPKPKHPLEALPKATFVLDDW
jgi:elongation factor 1-gamma